MSQQIDIPDVGLVEFPDGMSDEDITHAIKNNIIPQYTPAPKSAGDYVKDFGRGLASAVDTGANMVTGLGSYVGYPFGRAFGLNPQEATAAANRVGAPLQNPVGRAFGIENDPAYQNSAANKIVGGIGQGISSVAQPISNATGLPQQDVEHMLGTALIAAGPAIPKVAGAVGRGASAIGEGVKNVGGAASDVAQGAYHGFTNTVVRPGVTPKPWQTPSARQPIGDTYVTPESLQAWRAGEIPASDLTHRPTTDLPANALKQTQGMVPYQGQQYQALGEHIGTAYRDPKKLIAEALLDIPTGGFASAVRGGAHAIEAYKNYQAFNKLNQAGFTPITQAEHAAMKTGGMHPDLPNTTMNTAPVAPTAAPITPPPTAAPTTPNYQVPAYQRTNATIPGINAPVAPTTPPVGQLSPPTTPAQVQGANFIGNTEKKFGLTPVAPETITQKAQRVMGDNYRAPVSEQPITGPVAPAELPPPPAAPVTTAAGPIAPEGMPAPVAETPKPLPTPAEAAIIAQKAKPVKATNLPTAERGTGKKKTAEEKMMEIKSIQTPYLEGTTNVSPEELNRLIDHMRHREYMSGVEREKSRVKATGEVFTPTPLVQEILDQLPAETFSNPAKTFLDPSAGDGQFLSEVLLRKIQNGSTHKQALETTYGVDIKPDNVKLLRDRLIAGNESLRPIAENNLLVGNALNPFEKVPGQTPHDHMRMMEIFGDSDIEKAMKAGKPADAEAMFTQAKAAGVPVEELNNMRNIINTTKKDIVAEQKALEKRKANALAKALEKQRKQQQESPKD